MGIASRSVAIIVPFQPVFVTVYSTGYMIQKENEHVTKCSGKWQGDKKPEKLQNMGLVYRKVRGSKVFLNI